MTCLECLKNLDDFEVWPIKHRHWTFELVEDEAHDVWISTRDLRSFYARLPKAALTNQPTLLQATGPSFTVNLRFPGQYWDDESKLSYNTFRNYQPNQGRYTQPDPIGLEGGWSRFGYVGGNPMNKTDPTGLFAWWVVIPVGVAAYEAWDFYTNFRDFKTCVAACPTACEEGKTNSNASCKAMCTLQHWGTPNRQALEFAFNQSKFYAAPPPCQFVFGDNTWPTSCLYARAWSYCWSIGMRRESARPIR